jgi:hypothetical protein
MHHTDQRHQLRVNIETKECNLPSDELARIQGPLDEVAASIGDLPAQLHLTIVQHPHSRRFHVDAALRLPRETLFTGDWDSYLDTALERCVRKLLRKTERYHDGGDHRADTIARDIQRQNNQIVAPEDPDAGALGEAARSGDYHRFRKLLAGHEDWLRLRIGRWLQRYPQMEAELGRRVSIGDLVEEVLLNAFESFGGRSHDVPLHEWLDSLVDPSLQDFRHDPIDERENISFARTVRDTPLPS